MVEFATATPVIESKITRTSRSPTATPQSFELLPTYTPLPTNTPVPADSLPGFGYGPGAFPDDFNPLTGLKVPDPSILDRRPMVIKITNFPRSVRPQWGLTLADHVYEYYLEDGLTRFIGVFYGQDAERVGPVRSARPFDEHVVRMYKAIFAFGYADDRLVNPWMESDLLYFLVVERADNCPPLCRIGPENAYNTLYADTIELSSYITAKGMVDNVRQDLRGLRFEEHSLATSGGGEANRVEIRFSRTSHHLWEYDPLTERYLRWQEVESRDIGDESYDLLLDSLTAQPVGADNLVLLQVPTGYFYKSHSTEIYDIALKGEGDGFALRQGRIFKIKWARPTPKSLVSIRFPSGQPFPLKPGNVFFEILSEVTTHEVEAGAWRFYFDIDVPE